MATESVTHDRRAPSRWTPLSRSDVAVTVHRYEGGAGLTVYVQAAQHGIELTGTAAVRRLHDDLTTSEIAGTVVARITNSLAFDHHSYVPPQAFDVFNSNLNRVWPGDAEGTLQERLAERLWRLIEDADAIVNLHTGTLDMLEHVRFQDDDDSHALAEAFGVEHLLLDHIEEDDPDDFRGKFRELPSIRKFQQSLQNSRTATRWITSRRTRAWQVSRTCSERRRC